jgi:hypothetical protein
MSTTTVGDILASMLSALYRYQVAVQCTPFDVHSC